MVKVSILVPNYNGAEWLHECLDSLVNQTMKNEDYEIIVVDDASTDNSINIIQEYCEKYPNVKLLKHKKNQGECVALQTALNEAKGELVCICDADDRYVLDKLEVQSKYLWDNRLDMVYSDGYYISSDSKQVWNYDVFPFDSKMLRNFNFISEGSVMIKKEYLIKVGGFDPQLKKAEDWSLWLSVDEVGARIEKQSNYRSYYYRQHESMKSKSPDYEKYLKMIRKKHNIKEDFVCVGIPVYNANENYFKATLRSILNQTYPKEKYCVVVYDDGSTNGIAQKVCFDKEFKGMDLKYIYNPKNGGIGVARNQLIEDIPKEATHFAFLSSDDLWHPEFLRIMMELKNQFYDAILYCDISSVNEKGEVIQQIPAPKFSTPEDLQMGIVSSAEQDRMFINLSSILCPVELMIKFDPELKFGEDLLWVIEQALIHRHKFINVPQFLTYFRLHPDAMTTIKWNEIHQNNNKIRMKINKLLKKEVFKNV